MLQCSCYLNVQIVVYYTSFIIYRVLRFCGNHAHNCSLFLCFTSLPTTVISLIVHWEVGEGKENVLRDKMCTCIKLPKNISFIYTNNHIFKERTLQQFQFFHLGLIFHGILTVNRNLIHSSPKMDQCCIADISVDQLVIWVEITTLLIGGCKLLLLNQTQSVLIHNVNASASVFVAHLILLRETYVRLNFLPNNMSYKTLDGLQFGTSE